MVVQPRVIIHGWGALEHLPRVARSLGTRALLVVGKSFARRSGYLDRIVSMLRSAGVSVEVFEGVEPNPRESTCEAIASRIRGSRADMVVAFGGGSVIDAAKAGAVVASLGGRVRDYFYPRTVAEPVKPIIAIPTTCGTGSEVTRYAVITTEDGSKKLTVVGDSIVPYAAILDHEALTHLPKNLVAWTALDALSHALEAYITRRPTELSDSYALRAVEMILDSIHGGVWGGRESLERLHIASMLAGMAINAVGTNIVHAMGYYLTVKHGAHHGLANAVIMPYALSETIKAVSRPRLERLLRIFGCESIECFEKRLLRLCESLGVPTSLRAIGFEESELQTYVDDVMSYRRNLENAPISVSREVIESIARRAL